ncbi:patatin-like phospholipase family protein [Corallococcus exercitus]|uniref:patatin-like phospholipase family protein n=1 Tax=Corallococcus exercitus TaxID=2316736 RepID=UPI0035D51FA6
MLLERLLAAREVEEAAAELVRVLSESPRLTNAQDADLFRLVEGATPVRVKRGSRATLLFSELAVPGGFYVVLEGCCDLASSSSRPSARLEGPTCVGLDEFLTREPLPGAVELRPPARKWSRAFRLPLALGHDARAFHISREWFDHVREWEPDFDRAVVRGCPEEFQALPPHTAHQVIVCGEQEEDLPPWSALSELLAERMAVHLHEHVLVVRLKEGAKDELPKIEKPASAMNGWVAHCERPPSRTDLEPLLPPSTMTTWMGLSSRQDLSKFAGRTNVTLVDTSALTPRERQEVLQHLSERALAGEPIKYLSMSKDRHRPTFVPPKPIELVHAGLLRLPRPEQGLGLALAELFHDKTPWAKTKRAVCAADLVRKGAERQLRRLVTCKKSQEPEEWPMGTVRLRFPDPWRQREARLPTSLDGPGPELESLRESFERWARAATGRRVGLALGGGGSFGFADIALLDKLTPSHEGDGKEDSEPRVPIDMVAGSSFGAMVGAFYCVGGRGALELLIRRAGHMLPIVTLTAISSAILELWTNYQLGPWPLDEMEVPFFPVVTDADMGVEWDLRTGSIGRGVRASSALPPIFGPTLIGNRRLLDGGLVANVPTDVLRAEGADILIAANPISRVPPRSRSYPLTWVGPLWRQISPGMRIKDSLRQFQIIGRLAGTLQNRDGDTVVYQPQLTPATLLGFSNGQRIVEVAQSSPEVDAAALRARAAWSRRLNNPRWLHLVENPGDDQPPKTTKTPEAIELTLPLVFKDRAGGSSLTTTSNQILDELAEYLHTQKEIASFRIQLTAPDEHLARQRAHALADALKPRVFQEPVVKRPVRLPANGQEEATKGMASWVRLTVQDTQPRLTQDVMQEAASVMENQRYLLELQRTRADVRMRTLLSEAEQQGRQGAPEQAQRLALDAVESARPPLADTRPVLADTRPTLTDGGSTRKRPSPPPESQALLDGVLRGVLERRGTCLCVLSNRAALLRAAWSPDGRHLATGDTVGQVHLWDLQSPDAKPTRIHAGTSESASGVKALVWAARSNHLACCDDDARVWVMTVDGKGAHVLRPPYRAGTRAPWGLLLSPDEELLLGPYGNDGANPGDTARHAAVLGVTREARVPVCDPGPEQPPRCAEVLGAAWAPGGDVFATVGLDEVGVWRVTRREPRNTVTRQETFPVAGVLTVAWHPREQVLAAGGAKGVVVFRGSGDALKTQQLEPPDAVEHVAWSPDGQWLAAASTGTVRLWHADSGLLSNVLHVEAPSLGGLTWNPRRRGVLATWSGNVARVWDVERGQVLATLTGHAGSIHQVVWRPDGSQLVTVSSDATARIWDDTPGGPERRETWEQLEEQVLRKVTSPLDRWDYPRELPLEPGAPGTAWAFYNPANPRQAVIPEASSRSLGLWEGQDLSTAPSVRGRGLAATWSPDGRHVAVQDGPGTFSLWTASGDLKARWKEARSDLLRWVWHPGSKALGIVLRDEPEPRFWDLTSENPTHSRGQESEALWDVAWSPSGLQFATACDDGWARIYEASSGHALDQLLWSLRLVFPARRIAWSPDGHFLATGDAGGLVGIWDSRGYDLVASPQTHWGPIQHLVWNRSGSCLFTANEGGRGLLWRQGSDGRWAITAVLDAEPTALRWATFSTDGRWLLAMEADGAGIRRYPAEFETLVAQVAARPVPTRVHESGAPPRPAMPEPELAAPPRDADEADPGSWWWGYPPGTSPSLGSHQPQ